MAMLSTDQAPIAGVMPADNIEPADGETKSKSKSNPDDPDNDEEAEDGFTCTSVADLAWLEDIEDVDPDEGTERTQNRACRSERHPCRSGRFLVPQELN
jgi:hypothetical protein